MIVIRLMIVALLIAVVALGLACPRKPIGESAW